MSLRIKSTIYPLDYNKNNPMEGFNEWCEYIHKQVLGMEYTGQPVLQHYDHLKVEDIRAMHSLSREANELVNQNK